MNLNRFVDKYGCYTFDEVPFTEIDNVIFSYLSYLNLGGLVSANRFNKKRLQDVANEFFKNYSKKNKYVYVTRKAIKLFRSIKDTRRYKDLFFYNYVYESGNDEQFSAFTIEIQSKLVYVSFEGTDQLVSGWKEDFMFSYMFPTISQRRAIDYVNKHFLFRRKNIILGGHSKGGNLALVAGMYANFLVKDKIIKIYNNDGPGLLLDQIESKQYDSIENKLIHIFSDYAIVGLLLRHRDNYVVVHSMKKSVMAHDAMSWVVDDKEFKRSELSPFSKMLEEKLSHWLDKYDKLQRKRFVISLFDVFDRVGVKSLTDFVEHKTLIWKMLMEAKDIDSDVKKMIKEFLLVIFGVFKDVKVEELKIFFHKESKDN